MKAARHFIVQYLAILVVALTNLAFAWTILGCAPSAIHIVPADSTSFQRMMDAEITGNARRPAHLMKQYVRGDLPDKVGVLADDKLPEAYTQVEQRGVWPSNYHLGYAAERLIREHYGAAHPTQQVLESGDFVEIVDEAGGNLYMLNEFDKDRHPDIVNIERRFVFEVVPPGQAQRVEGKKRVDWNLLLINKAMIGVPTFSLGTGYAGEVGVRFAEGAAPWKLTWQTMEPGVVQYEWHALSAAKATEAAYGKAYLDNRWHDPTTYEITCFARALHEVVERLVQAREALGQTRAASTMPILPGKTEPDYLRSVTLWSAVDERIARLLPVMREPPPPPPVQVRRGARFIGQTVGGGSSGTVRTIPGPPGNQPWNFHMGNSAHKLIGEQYETMHLGERVVTNSVSVSKIVELAEGNPDLLLPGEKLIRPDITNIDARLVFEIKPSGPNNLVAGQTAVTLYITAINRALPPTARPFSRGMGFTGALGVKFAGGAKIWQLTWDTTAPGVVQYKWQKLGVKEEEQAKAEAINKAENEGRWVDLTEATRIAEAYKKAYEDDRWVELADDEMQQYAEQLEEAVDMLVGNRQQIRRTQEAVNIPMEVTGIAASSVLSAELSRLMTAIGARPIQRRAPASVPGGPVPAPARAPLRLVPVAPPVPGTRPALPPPPQTLPRKAAKLQTRTISI